MKKIFIYSLIALLFIPISSKAADKYTLLEPLPCIPGTASKCDTDANGNKIVNDMALEDYIGYIYKFAIALAAFLAVIVVIWGGFQYMTTDSIGSKKDAKEKFKNAGTGLLMVLASYLILRTIDPRLVEINTSIPAIKIDTSGLSTFKTQLDADLSALTVETRDISAALDKSIQTKQERLDELSALSLSEDLTAEQELEYNTLKQDISDLNKAQATNLVNGTIANKIGLILDPVSGAVSQEALDTINKNFDAAIAILDPQKDSDKIVQLKGEKAEIAAYIEQQKASNVQINAYKASPNPTLMTHIKEQIIKDQATRNNVATNDAIDPVFKKEFTALMQSRIDAAKKVIGMKID